MTQQPSHHASAASPRPLPQLGLIARLAIGSSLIAASCLVALGWVLEPTGGATYREVIWSHALSKQSLPTALLVAGLSLVTCVGALTWLLALLGSFRVAGPLYRLARNLEAALGGEPLIGVRRGDALQDTVARLATATAALDQHYAALREAAAAAALVLDDPRARQEGLRTLAEVERRVRL
ncbi:MAG: hypothetical protein AMJ69_01410 [Gammaproteobacteria bacterium SG8_47]|nr:MAG: hypothetical protein AMJ69_01410 [Gammaproteobacteria bacterium SG8_47]